MAILLTNLTLIDGTGAPPVRDAALVLDGARIVAVHTRPRPPGAFEATVDLAGRTCVPGLVNRTLSVLGIRGSNG